MLPIVPDRHGGACRLLPEGFVMRPCPVRCERVDDFPSFHGVHEHLRVVTVILLPYPTPSQFMRTDSA